MSIEFTPTEDNWQSQALCAETDPELFYSPSRADQLIAKQMCKECPVVKECLMSALENDEPFGIWGGTTTEERKRMRNARRNNRY